MIINCEVLHLSSIEENLMHLPLQTGFRPRRYDSKDPHITKTPLNKFDRGQIRVESWEKFPLERYFDQAT